MAMSQSPYSGARPAAPAPSFGQGYPAPSNVEKRIDPADGQTYGFDEICGRLQSRGVDPVQYWYERMGVQQPNLPPAMQPAMQPTMQPAMQPAMQPPMQPPMQPAPAAYAQAGSYPQYGATQPSSQKPKKGLMKVIHTSQNFFFIIGAMILFVLCIVPVWNSILLLMDSNYVFWVGRYLPIWIIIVCLGTIGLYALTALIFCSCAHPTVQTDQSVMMIANVFVTLFGVILMLASLPLMNQGNTTFYNLMDACESSDQTHRLFEYSQVLHNIRDQPQCEGKYSVEECPGYEAAPPYTEFLKEMETKFRCSGFCYKPPHPSFSEHGSNSTKDEESNEKKGKDGKKDKKGKDGKGGKGGKDGKGEKEGKGGKKGQEGKDEKKGKDEKEGKGGKDKNSELQEGEDSEKHKKFFDWSFLEAPNERKKSLKGVIESHFKKHANTQLSLLSDNSALSGHIEDEAAGAFDNDNIMPAVKVVKSKNFPKALFSDSDFQASCEGMAARDMKYFAGEVGSTTFYQGIYLVLIAVFVGFMKLLSYCWRTK